MVIEVKVSTEGLDLEWLALISEARNLGIEVEEIRKFLQKSSTDQTDPLK